MASAQKRSVRIGVVKRDKRFVWLETLTTAGIVAALFHLTGTALKNLIGQLISTPSAIVSRSITGQYGVALTGSLLQLLTIIE